jgi:cyanophycinase-like exopeptidase
MISPRGFIAIMGSGETTDSMVRVHRYLLDKLPPPVKAAFIDTPAGFQMNADDLYDKAGEYFQKRLNQPIERVTFKSAKQISPFDAEKAYQTLRSAGYIFVGPGSPTYALKNWQSTPIAQILLERIQVGGCFVAASAAALTLGKFTLPVYEIYKVGEDLFWADGLDLLGKLGLPLVVVPHWNNAEGGTHDTRFCYMGESRLLRLEGMLPPEVSILGIDEHTACILDFQEGQFRIRGVGTVTLRRGQTQKVFRDGESLSLVELRNLIPPFSGTRLMPPPSSSTSPPPPEFFLEKVDQLRQNCEWLLQDNKGAAVVDILIQLDKLIWKSCHEFEDEERISQAREMFRTLIVHLGLRFDACPKDVPAVIAPLMNIMMDVRHKLRLAKQWALADEIRDQLTRAGFLIEDRPEGPRWRRKP